VTDPPRPSDEAPTADEDLLRRVRAGDEAASRLFFERRRPALRGKLRDASDTGP
jgi:hypothetical protein